MTSPLSTSLSPIAAAPAASAQANTYTDLNALASLKNAPSSPATIKAVSEQVEALFLQMMLKSMRDASEAAGEPTSNETGMYQDMFDKQVALTLSKRQDLGIARLFERQLGGAKSRAGRFSGDRRSNHGRRPQLKPAPETPRFTAAARPAAATSANLPEQAAEFVQAGAADHPAGRRRTRRQPARHAGPGRARDRLGPAHAAHRRRQFEPESVWREGGQRVERRPRRGGHRGDQRRRREAEPHRLSSLRLHRGERRRFRPSAGRLAPLSRGDRAGGDAQAYIQSIAKAGYATDPEYANKLNEVLNSGTLRAALGARLAKL